jgi:hypothetical protein
MRRGLVLSREAQLSDPTKVDSRSKRSTAVVISKPCDCVVLKAHSPPPPWRDNPHGSLSYSLDLGNRILSLIHWSSSTTANSDRLANSKLLPEKKSNFVQVLGSPGASSDQKKAFASRKRRFTTKCFVAAAEFKTDDRCSQESVSNYARF